MPVVNPGIRRQVAGAITRLFNSAAFALPLTHTAVPQRGSITPTFTRATTETGQKYDEAGYLDFTALAGEMVFKGARREYNQWTTSSVSLASGANKSLTLAAGTYQFSMGAGTGTATFSGTGGATGTLAASTGRVSVAKTITAGTFVVTASVADLADLQVCNITGETDQTTIRPYVSVGVPSDWAGTDLVTNGTFDSDTTGWTARNIVSLSVVAGKLRVTNGAFGGAEQVITTVVGVKYVLSRNFTAGTSSTCITQVGTSSGNNDIYAGGNITDQYLAVEFTATSTTTYIQVYLGDGTGGNYADFDNISVKPAYYHGSMVDGVKCYDTDRSGNPISTSGSYPLVGYVPWEARTNLLLQSAVVATQSITVAAVAHTLSFKGTGTITLSGVSAAGPLVGTGANDRVTLTFTPTAGSLTLTVSGSCTVGQLEAGSFATPYIPTTTVAVARNADVDQYPTTAGPIAAAGSIALDFTPYHAPSGTIALWGTYVDASNYTAILHDATNLIFRKRIAGSNYDATIANAFVSGTTCKIAATWGAAGTAIYLDGVAGTPHANTTAAQIAATMQVGADGNSLQQPGAGTTNLRIWQRQLSSPEGVAVTA